MKTFLKRTLIVTGCAAVILTLALIGRFIRPPQPGTVPSIVVTKPAPVKLAKVTYGLPVRLQIPTIGVNAALDYIAITPAGELGTPKGPNNAAWYDRGPRPGQVGDAIIDGHFGYKDNIPAVFDNLSKLQVGANIYIQDDGSRTITFIVRSTQTLAQDQSDSSVFISDDNKAHLNLITCQGDWDQATQSYSDRLVVFADKV